MELLPKRSEGMFARAPRRRLTISGVESREKSMKLSKTSIINAVLLVLGVAFGTLIAVIPANAASTGDALPIGRKAVAIVDGRYPASYFPNNEC